MKKIISLVLVAVLALTAIGGTLAYFTDTEDAKNTFTVGNVDIELLESMLHRVNAGVPNGETSESELWSDVEMEGDGCYTDEQIEKDAAHYQENLALDNKLNPGEYYHKMPYVKNIGSNPAYIRIRVMMPAALDTTILNSSMMCSNATKSGEFVLDYDATGTVEREGVKYNVYQYTRTTALEPNEMTYWNVWGTVHMDSHVTEADIKTLCPNGFDVLVEADAIQAESFADYTEAWAAFDAQQAVAATPDIEEP